MRLEFAYAVAVAASIVIGCGGASESKTASAPTTSTTSAAAPAAPSAPRPSVDRLKRADVKATIAKGLGAFLRNVSVEDYPVMKDGKYHGFRVRALTPDWAIDLRPGDIVTRVNDHPIEHPEEADAAMRLLEKAPALKVDYEREGKARTLQIPIVD